MRIRILPLAFFLLTALGHSQSESTYVHTGWDRKAWTIGNSLVEREIRLNPQMGLYTASWRQWARTLATCDPAEVETLCRYISILEAAPGRVYKESMKTRYDEPHRLVGIEPRGWLVRMM
jgi:hypothetical protein